MIAWEEYVEVNPEVLVGKPVIKGTRVSVEFIMERLADGWTEEEILENYPSLDRNIMQAVYSYAYETIKEVVFFSIVEKKSA
ncbi:MAG: DUF433 domain-containing protein [Bacteroidota bacterium]